MKAVGIKMLKNNLSRYLKEVRDGEHIWVTDRDQVVAEIHKPTSHIAGRVSRWDAFLSAEERRGRLRRANRPDVRMDKLPSLPKSINAKGIRDEIRADRR